MDRRTFLRQGLKGGAVLAAGACTLHAFPPPSTWVPQDKLRVLDERGFAVLAAIAARTVCDPVADPVAIAHAVDRTLALGPLELGQDVGRLLGLFESGLVGLFLDGRPLPFTRLSEEGQDQVLAAWRDSKLPLRHSGYVALRKLTLAAHYASPRTWEGIGYPGPPELAGG